MKVYHLNRKQTLPINLETAWGFFSDPTNLNKITPDEMSFNINYISGGNQVYPGQIVIYKIKILGGFRVSWVTEITQVMDRNYFIDEQRFGPYALWHHQHHFKATDGGIEMIDEVNYAIPFGVIGRFAHWLFVERQVNAIFDHRYKVLETYFAKGKVELLTRM
jgi:ligand-binding SRPBCC domain-containing protein